MFVTKNQFFVFLACLAFGAVSGVLFSVSAGVKFLLKNKFFKCVSDVVAFLPLGWLFTCFSFYFGFPNLRFYMLVGVCVGIALYFKSFHILLAKIAKKFYNILVIKISRNKKAKDDRSKVKKDNRGNHGRGSTPIGDINIHNGLPTNINKGAKRQRGFFRWKNSRV